MTTVATDLGDGSVAERGPERASGVLLVEAEPDQGIYWELIFRSLGFAVLRVTTLREARAALTQADHIGIVACDSVLPDGSGVEFFAQLRARPDLSLTYLLLLTSSGEEIVASLHAGANDCLQVGASYGEIRARLELAERVIGLTRALDKKSAQLDEALQVLKGELTAAAKLQSSLLPKRREHGGFSLEAFYAPAGALGGDMLGVTPVIRGRIAFGLIDVVGHGTGSALISCSLIRELIDRLSGLLARGDVSDPLASGHAVIDELNHRYCDFGLPGMYFTALAGVLDLASGEVAWCQAGHPSLLVFDQHRGWQERSDSGYPVGLIDGAEYELHRLRLGPGCMMLAISDGLLRQSAEDPAGTAALLGLLRTSACTPEAALGCLQSHAASAAGAERDDQSALLLSVLSEGAAV